jgi:hypothetical protein
MFGKMYRGEEGPGQRGGQGRQTAQLPLGGNGEPQRTVSRWVTGQEHPEAGAVDMLRRGQRRRGQDERWVRRRERQGHLRSGTARPPGCT